MPTDPPTLTEVAEAILIDLAEKAGVDRKLTQRGLKISESTYYRRRNLAGEVAAWRAADAEFDRTEAGCR